MDLKKQLFHFTSGDKNEKQIINFGLYSLKLILDNKCILSRNMQIQNNGNFLTGFQSTNLNGSDYISICKYNSSIEKDDAYTLMNRLHSICVILERSILKNLEVRYFYNHMEGEYQIKNMIPLEYFKGIGILFNQDVYYKHDITQNKKIKILKHDIELLSMVNEIIKNYKLSIYALNSGNLASDYLEECKKFILT